MIGFKQSLDIFDLVVPYYLIYWEKLQLQKVFFFFFKIEKNKIKIKIKN